MPQDPKSLLATYLPQHPLFEKLAEEVKIRLNKLTADAGLRPTITSRAKDLRSLIKKCLLHDGSVDQTPDRAGVKVIVRYTSEVVVVNELITGGAFIAGTPDRKLDRYRPHELGYLGTHHQVKLLPSDCLPELADMECEIIIHTAAEALWDGITHELMYKPFLELPQLSQRSLHRLLALVELFDKEVGSVRNQYTESPHYREARMLDILEKYFYQVDPGDYRKEMSIQTLEALAPAITADKLSRFDAEIGTWFAENLNTLRSTFDMYRDPDDIRGLFLHQPEALLIFAMFDWNQKFDVKEAWVKLYPLPYLQDLAGVWGIPIPD